MLNNITNIHSYWNLFFLTFDDCRDINLLPFDFYLPDYNLCIEYDGIHHFEINEYFGGVDRLKYTKKHDKIKNIYCKLNNIKLIRISYKDDIIKTLKYLKF